MEEVTVEKNSRICLEMMLKKSSLSVERML